MSDRDNERVEYRGTGFYVGLAAILLLALALFILAVQNTQDVSISFLGWEFEVPLFAVAIGAALGAVIVDELIGLVWRRRRRAQLTERAELHSLRDQVGYQDLERSEEGEGAVDSDDTAGTPMEDRFELPPDGGSSEN